MATKPGEMGGGGKNIKMAWLSTHIGICKVNIPHDIINIINIP